MVLEKVKAILRELSDSGKICPKVTSAMLEHFDEIIGEVNRGSKELYDLYHKMEDEYERIYLQYLGKV